MKGFFRNNGGLLVVAAVLLAALLAILSAITGANPITNALQVITRPVGSLTSGISNWFQGQHDRLTGYDQLLEENEKLKLDLRLRHRHPAFHHQLGQPDHHQRGQRPGGGGG